MTAKEIAKNIVDAAPTTLSPEARRFMGAVGEKLEGIAEEVDEGALRMLMLSYDMYVKASDVLLREGPILRDKRGKPAPHPAEKVAKTYYAQVLAFMREYGLTVRSRERIKAYDGEAAADDDLMMFLKGGG